MNKPEPRPGKNYWLCRTCNKWNGSKATHCSDCKADKRADWKAGLPDEVLRVAGSGNAVVKPQGVKGSPVPAKKKEKAAPIYERTTRHPLVLQVMDAIDDGDAATGVSIEEDPTDGVATITFHRKRSPRSQPIAINQQCITDEALAVLRTGGDGDLGEVTEMFFNPENAEVVNVALHRPHRHVGGFQMTRSDLVKVSKAITDFLVKPSPAVVCEEDEDEESGKILPNKPPEQPKPNCSPQPLCDERKVQ